MKHPTRFGLLRPLMLIAACAASSVSIVGGAPVEPIVRELPATGVNVARQRGGWINAEFSGARMVVRFFDGEKKPISPEVEVGSARLRRPGASGIVRTTLGREGEKLVSPSNVRPPHNFLVTLALPSDAGAPPEVVTFKYP